MTKPIFENTNKDSFPTLAEIYKKSKIEWEDYMDECIILSVKTSNNQEIIENMEFYKFRSLIKSLNKYLKAENASNNGETNQEDVQKQTGDLMNNAKNTMGKIKAPKVPKLK